MNLIRIVGVGDNVVDRYIHQGKMYPGGNSLNFAVYGKQLGHDSAYIGVLANDQEAKTIVSALKKLGVDISKCQHVHGETGRCSTLLINGDRIISDDNDFGAVKTTPLQLTPERLEYIGQFDVAHTSCYSFIDDQLPKIKRIGIPLVYDFSDIWEEKDFEIICPHIDIAFFSGKKLPDDKLQLLMKKTVDLGCSLAICTIGKRGAMIYNGSRYFIKCPYNVDGQVVDTLGAGDSFLTGFITAYIEGLKRYNALVAQNPDQYTTQNDRDDYMENLIEYSMSVGNLLAIKNCMIYGAFGYSADLPI